MWTLSVIGVTLVLSITSHDLTRDPTDKDAFPCGGCTCSGIAGKHADCSRMNFTAIPPNLPRGLLDLNLAVNGIHSLEGLGHYPHLRKLNLSVNLIKQLSNTSFSNLGSLRLLDLQRNGLNLSGVTYPRDVFSALTNLTVIYLQDNSDVSRVHDYPGCALSALHSLEELHMDGSLNASFGAAFRNMNLSSLIFDGMCNIRFLTNRTFENVRTLRHLYLVHCNLVKVADAAFSPLSDLLTLDLSENVHLGYRHALRSTRSLGNSSLKILKLNNLQQSREPGILVKVSDTSHLKHMHLEEFYADHNRIEILETLVPATIPASLKVLSLRANMFYYGLYLGAMSAMVGVERLYLSNQHASYIDPFKSSNHHQSYISRSSSRKTRRVLTNLSLGSLSNTQNIVKDLTHTRLAGVITIHLPPNMTFVDIHSSKLNFAIPKIKFAANKVRYADFSRNFFTAWHGPLSGADNIEYFDISENFCDNVSDVFFSEVSSLKYLNVSYNQLAYTLTNNTFKNLYNLELLNISNNKLLHLPRNIFKNLKSLKILDLSNNFLSTLQFDMNNLSNFQLIDLSSNLLESVPDEITVFVQHHPEQLHRISFTGNPLECTCQTLTSLKWVISNQQRLVSYEHLSCRTDSQSEVSFKNLHLFVSELEKECLSNLGVLIGSLIAMFICLALVVAGLVFRYRWKLRYLYHLARLQHRNDRVTEEDEFVYDAFISYADEDRAVVIGEMRTILEDDRGLRLCIHHRDFLPGTGIADNILEAVRSSRRTVVILSRHFLESQWCRYELEMARMEDVFSPRRTILLVLLGDVQQGELSLDILRLMQSESYLEYTDDRDGRDLFYDNLHRGITVH